MLRLRPTVISLTRTDVSEVVHRRRFRKFLECDEDDACIASNTVEFEAICNPDQSKPSSSRIVDRETRPRAYSRKRHDSPSWIYSRVRPLVADLPLILPSNKGFEEDVFPSPEMSGRRGRRPETKESPRQGSTWTPQLCLRPKRSLATATTTVADIDPDRSTGSHDSLESHKQELSSDGQKTEQSNAAIRETTSSTPVPDPHPFGPAEQISSQPILIRRASAAGPSTPRRILSSYSSLDNPIRPTLSHQASPEPLDDSHFCRGLEGSRPGLSFPVSTGKAPARLRVYNDFLPAASGPQTPQNLSEVRHQNCLRGSYTAPARCNSPRLSWTPRTGTDHREFGRRESSPLVLRTPEFASLYGIIENMDDDVLVEVEEMADWASPRRSSLA